MTRRSILELAREWGEFKVTERFITMPDIVKAHEEGRVSVLSASRGPTASRDDERFQVVAETYGNWLCMDCFQLIEAFGAGTAAVVCPIKAIVYKDKVGP